jgi:hypothetical protein
MVLSDEKVASYSPYSSSTKKRRKYCWQHCELYEKSYGWYIECGTPAENFENPCSTLKRKQYEVNIVNTKKQPSAPAVSTRYFQNPLYGPLLT